MKETIFRAAKLISVALGVVVATPLIAQTVTTSGGNGGTIPVFTGAATIVNSNIFEVNGLVGIGIPLPAAPLTIQGNVVVGSNYHGDATLQLIGPAGCCQRMTQIEASGPGTDALNIMSSNDTNGAPHYWTWGVSQDQWTINPGLTFTQNATTFTINSSGYVGIGTFTPRAGLEVANGNVILSGTGASVMFADGSVQSTAWNGTLLGGDYAESIDVLGDRAGYESGDVICIDSDSPGKFTKTDQAYSKLVAGVFSTKPGLVGRRATVERSAKAAEVPMAMAGIVPIKASAENGVIQPGDLLVSATKPGYAMKGTEVGRLTGAVIGKALGSLSSGYGVVEVMISLQ